MVCFEPEARAKIILCSDKLCYFIRPGQTGAFDLDLFDGVKQLKLQARLSYKKNKDGFQPICVEHWQKAQIFRQKV